MSELGDGVQAYVHKDQPKKEYVTLFAYVGPLHDIMKIYLSKREWDALLALVKEEG